MVNISFIVPSEDMMFIGPDGETQVYNLGDISWVLTSTALVWLIIPGTGFFYSGLLRRKNALAMIFTSMLCVAVVGIQWFFWGYSLVYSDTASRYIGDLRYFALRNVLEAPSIVNERIPSLLFCVYQMMFAAITAALAAGAIAERGRIGPLLVFTFIWTTIVYDPIACWTWNPSGWSNQLGGLDFAGGTPVHVSSGAAALAISLYLKPRLGYGREAFEPHNNTYVILGTAFFWFGWFGFNGGTALGANLKAVNAVVVTTISASAGGLTWMIWDYRVQQRWHAVSFCSGAIAGLIAITPGAGYVGVPASLLFGFLAGTVCNFATQLKYILGVDDTLDIFASHGIGGILGNLLTGIFAQRSVAAYDHTTNIKGGWLDGHWIQLAYQLADSAAGFSYAFVVTMGILWAMHYVPGLRLRSDPRAEGRGMDDVELGESAYDFAK
ncbi:ammonium transporter [Pluteus cervinus]|uniref:Ammonium transporter n=1 Tax=Pluteus cervinus TaxID=181527 RepID=A0ACD3B166_9AGAR|nr:ammonium transporter [Pluteus cervinus]